MRPRPRPGEITMPSDPVAGRETARCPLAKYPSPALGPSGLTLIIPELYFVAPPMSYLLLIYLLMLPRA